MNGFLKLYRNEILLGILLFCLYGLTCYNLTISNDSCSNMQQVQDLDILSRSSHFGFHFLAVAFHLLFSFSGFSSAITSTQVMLMLLSVAGSIALYRLVLHHHNEPAKAFFIALLYALASNTWRFSVQCEYHIMVPSLSLLALLLLEKNKPVFSGLVFGFSVLTSFFSFWMLPMLFIQPLKISRRDIGFFMAGFMGIYLGVSLFTATQTFAGEWSYKWVFEYNKNTVGYIEPVKVIASCLYGYFRSFSVFLPLFFLGLYKLYKQNQRLFRVVLFTLIIHLPAAIPENRYGGYQMTFYPLFAITCSSVFFPADNALRKWLSALVILIFAAISAFVVYSERNFQHKLKNTYLQMQQDARIPDRAVVLMYQATKPFNTVYAPRLKAVSIFTSQQEVMNSRLVRYNAPDYNGLLKQKKSLFMLESGTSEPDDYLKVFFASFLRNHGVKTKGFGAEKIRKLYPEAVLVPLSGYSQPVYSIEFP